MSAQDWSPEPIFAVFIRTGVFHIHTGEAISDDNDRTIDSYVPLAVMDHADNGSDDWRERLIPATAKRLAQCYNAMAGISDPAALVDAFEKLLDFAKVAAAEPGANAQLLACAEMVIARAEAARK